MTAGAPLLELEQVNKWFGDLHVLQDVGLYATKRGERPRSLAVW
jgi:ABC-type polar amino acid transport system ATPase subunit